MSPAPRLRHSEYELLPCDSRDSALPYPRSTFYHRLTQFFLPWLPYVSNPTGYAKLGTPRRRKRGLLRILLCTLFAVPYLVLFLVLFDAAFLPSYTHRPPHYNELRRAALASTSPGRANPKNHSVFIATSIYERNGTLTGGAWGRAVLGLIDLLGPQNVYLSLYENNPDPVSKEALRTLRQSVSCNATINDESLPMQDIPHVTLPSGERRVKRIAFLAETRNRALLPLEDATIAFDRLLFINDVLFDPVEAAQLLFSTNVDDSGNANYGAACAVDFINPFKFYDRFATRDLDGYSMGIPFFPWFTDAGSHASRSDVLAGKDAVRVRSCWGGMAAYEAKWFQKSIPQRAKVPSNTTDDQTTPLRFRAEEEPYWDASECCLINADLQYRRSGVGMPEDSGVYMNPFIRVAYDEHTLSWLSLTRRPERLYSIIHNILNHMVGFPMFNPRRTDKPGEAVSNTDLNQHDSPPEDRSSSSPSQPTPETSHMTKPGGFCGGRKLLLLNEDAQGDEPKWSNVPIPTGSS